MKKLIASMIAMASVSACSQLSHSHPTVTAISEPTGLGQRVTTAIVQYADTVDNAKLNAQQFSVENRQILRAYANNQPSKSTQGTNGRYVVLELNPNDAAAAMTKSEKREPAVEVPVSLKVAQTAPIASTSGEIAPSTTTSTHVQNQVMDDFQQDSFTDPKTGITIKYNFYIPKNNNKNQKYPLVMFIHDAGTTNTNVRNTLLQGNGATTWASPEFQAKHPAFVLAPQFDHAIVNDQSDDPKDLDALIHLIEHLQSKYNIDNSRLYTTGQSGGAMMSLAMNIKYPQFFTASYIVAGQWDAEKTAPIAKNKLAIVVSQDDPKAFPGENAILKVLAKNGAKIAESQGWNGSDIAAMNQSAAKLLQQNANVYYGTIASGSLPAQKRDPNSKGAAHMGTWEVAYQLDSVKEWLFQQKK